MSHHTACQQYGAEHQLNKIAFSILDNIYVILLEVPSWRYWGLAHFLHYFIHHFSSNSWRKLPLKWIGLFSARVNILNLWEDILQKFNWISKVKMYNNCTSLFLSIYETQLHFVEQSQLSRLTESKWLPIIYGEVGDCDHDQHFSLEK